ncbi:thiamine biosynthesis protein ThiS [Hahella sp. CCB-MM4]|uniref:MoaD/ThiS family protein n=1 Tax=Hahella sp. (strain CCB-MM4) TaxID=1926491 RepID=UPI000B9AE452|nr:MoaD/ThiS family protein [Hahella sp. CCB-MM4]OZG70200.1 thiamine biosynthesis protein ThiS [Hahella sp. CCB-MM4]
MAKVIFTPNLERYLDCPPQNVDAESVAEALAQAFEGNQRLAGYILDDQHRLRKNIAVFVDGIMIRDRLGLSDPVQPASEVHVLQALSGG